jgi:hypothetical protein
MKIPFKVTAIIAGILFSALWSCAQVPPPPNPANSPALTPPPPGPPGQPRPGPQPPNSLQQLTAVNGKVSGYLTNDRYEYDGLSLQAGNNTITVRFPAHLGAQVMKSAPKGSEITINGFYENSPLGANEFHLVNATIGNTVITDALPAANVTPPAEVQQNFTGSISDFRRGPDGMVNGLILGGKEVIELPPPAAGQLQGLLTAGEKISGTGIKTIPPDGVVMAQNLQVIHPQTLTVNGQTYLIR